MEIRQLRTLIAVVETGSFTKAADKLFVSQPTISAHIRALEEDLKTQLFVRSTKNIEITKRGKDLYDTARSIVALEEQLLEKWQNVGYESMHLGASTIPSGYILPDVVKHFLKKHSNARFVIEHGDSSEIIEGIEKGLYDIGFVGMSTKNEAVQFTAFCEDNLVLITPNNDKFAAFMKDGTIPTEELKKLPFVIREAGSASGRAAQRVLKELNLTESDLNITARLNDLESIKNFVASGIGVSIISDRAVADSWSESKLLRFDLPVDSRRKFYIAKRKNKVLIPTGEEFIAFAKRYCAKSKH